PPLPVRPRTRNAPAERRPRSRTDRPTAPGDATAPPAPEKEPGRTRAAEPEPRGPVSHGLDARSAIRPLPSPGRAHSVSFRDSHAPYGSHEAFPAAEHPRPAEPQGAPS